jgi:hypothetical protein
MRALFATLVAVATIAAGCGGDSGSSGSSSGGSSSPTSPTGSTSPQGLEGTWKATKAEFISAANASKRADVVTQGTIVTLAITGSSFVLTMADPGKPPTVTNGTWTSTRDTMSLKPNGVTWSWQFDMTQSGNNLTLNGASVEFDFAANGVFEQAKLYMTLVRQ